jgi:hypothetical protein
MLVKGGGRAPHSKGSGRYALFESKSNSRMLIWRSNGVLGRMGVSSGCTDPERKRDSR